MRSLSLLEEKTQLLRERWWADLLLFAVAFFLMFWALGYRGLWTSEGRWAEITREMLLTKNFFHPTIGGEPYFDKPLLTYWLVALASVVAGNLNELIVRLPSAIAGVFVIWATLTIGTRLWSVQTGRIAAWILLTTYGFLFWSRTGTAEMENLAAIMLAIAWYWSRRDRPGFLTFQVFYLITFVGALTKGLTAIVVPVLVVLPDIIQNKRWRALLRPSHVLALAFAMTLYIGLFLYASMTRPENYDASGLGLVFQENILRYVKPFDHKGPVYLYLYYVPTLLLPWAPLWVVATVGTLKIWKSLDDKTKWVVKAEALILIFFTLSGSRRGYYILPIIPFCALLTAVFVVRIRNHRTDAFRHRGLRIQRALLIIFVLLELIAPSALVILKPKIAARFSPILYVSTVVIGISALLLSLTARKSLQYLKLESKTNSMLIPSIVMTTVLLSGYFCWQENILDVYRSERPFALDVKARTANLPPESIGFFRKQNATLLFYLDRDEPLRVLREATELQDFMAADQPQVLITQRRYISSVRSQLLDDFQAKPDIQEKVGPWDSESSREEKWVAWLLNKAVAEQGHY